MPTSPEAAARTRAFARVIGPWLAIVPAIIAVRAPDLGAMAAGFFQTPIIVWITGALLLFCGLLIIAFHQYWSGASAILISLFGWFLALRGFALLAFPDLFERAVDDTAGATSLVRAGFAGLVLIGLWLTYEGWLRKPPA
ncbi:hypothetical protein BN1110_05135 [bacterium YEK0313]|nr:hypothetical protein BN1110_05135 [bacterium YEK0313]